MKILIIQTAFIGDVILATPLISELKRIFPQSHIDVLVRKGNETLLANNTGIHRVLTWDKKEKKALQLLRVLRQLRRDRYDTVINLQRFFSTGILTAFSGATLKIGFDKNPLSTLFTTRVVHRINEHEYEHETARNLKLIAQFGAVKFAHPVLFPSPDDFSFVKGLKECEYFCIAPTSVWFTKQVPGEKWEHLIHLLTVKYPDKKIYLIGGPSDFAACDQIRLHSNTKAVVNLAGKLSFLQTAALMKDATMNYVNDSAPLHMTSAMNAPVTVFYCSTIPAFGFGPLSDHQKIIEDTTLKCRPCGLHGHKSCPEGHFACGLHLDMAKALP